MKEVLFRLIAIVLVLASCDLTADTGTGNTSIEGIWKWMSITYRDTSGNLLDEESVVTELPGAGKYYTWTFREGTLGEHIVTEYQDLAPRKYVDNGGTSYTILGTAVVFSGESHEFSISGDTLNVTIDSGIQGIQLYNLHRMQ